MIAPTCHQLSFCNDIIINVNNTMSNFIAGTSSNFAWGIVNPPKHLPEKVFVFLLRNSKKWHHKNIHVWIDQKTWCI